MSSLVINQDVIQEIISRFPASDIGKARLLNKECNKRSYESWFQNLNFHRTNSIYGYFVQYIEEGYKFQTGFVHERRDFNKNGVSIDFLPPGTVNIKACDASHRILLCVNDTEPSGVSEYIICKPTTKQYQIIPQSEIPKRGITFGLAVIQSNPFRYKIVRLSRTRGMTRNLRTFVCEVFDSGSSSWKRLKNLRLPREDGLILSNPVQASGFLNWLSWENNVIRFCLETETWSFFQTPNFGVSPKLVNYEGKLGVIRWCRYEELYRLWVLKCSFKKSWVKVKDVKKYRAKG